MHYNRITGLASVFINLFTILVLILSMFLGGTQKAAALGNPRIVAIPNRDFVNAIGWPLGNSVTITVDDPDTTNPVDFQDSGLIEVAPWDPSETYFRFNLEPFDLQAGFVISITDTVTTKNLTVSNVEIQFPDENDVELDIVRGIAQPGTSVRVILSGFFGGEATRDVVADINGNWSANFQTIFDLGPGVDIEAQQDDPDGDTTRYHIWTLFPVINVLVNEDLVGGNDWPLGEVLTIEIDDPVTTLVNPDFETTTTASVADWDPNQTWFEINPVGYDLKTGDIVTIIAGGISKQLTIPTLVITEVDLDTDTVYGLSKPDQQVEINTCYFNNPCINQSTTADQDGIWSASFASNGQASANIRGGSWVAAIVRDEDSDTTRFGYGIPNPSFAARANDDFIEGYQWPLGETVLLEIDDPATQLVNPDYTQSTVAAAAEWDPNQTWLPFEPISYDIKTGDIVTLSSNGIIKESIVANLAITEIDLLADVVHGTADPDQAVSVSVCGDDFCIFRDETSDPSGNWSANFAVPSAGNGPEDTIDIRSGIWIDAFIWDQDSDTTSFGLTAEAPQCQPGNSVSGAVFEHDGTTPIQGANIQIENFNTGEILFTALTDQNGQFGCSLPNGGYRVMATRDNYSREYFDQAHDTNAALLDLTTGAQIPDINFTLSRLPTMEHLTFNLDNVLLQELSVRQAIFLGTDRQEILNEAFLPNGNFGLISNSIVPSEHWAAAPASELTLYPYDPAQAEAILDDAEWINRDADVFRENAGGTELAFTFKTTPAALRAAAAELFRQYMEQIGIRITVITVPASEFFGPTGTVVQGDFDIAEFAWGGSFDDETYLEPYITGDNSGGYSNPAFDAAMASAKSAATEGEGLPYYYEAQAILTQDLPIIPLFTRYAVAPVATDPGSNVTVSPETYLDVHFGEVTDGGVTTVLPLDIDPADLPPNFQVLGEVYDIGTSASFTSAQVCFSYDDAGLTLAQESAIRLFHLENGLWMDVTDDGYPDMDANQVCGTVNSFSPFIVVYSNDSTPPAITWIGSINNGDNFHYGFVPSAPTCTAADSQSGVNDGCSVTGYSSALGSHTLVATAQDNAGNIAAESRTYTVLPWMLNGFYQPVDMNGVYNLVKNGSTVPLKFEVFAGPGELTDPALIQSLTYAQISCNSMAITDEIETTATDGTSLRYDAATGQFIYNWKTPKVAGNCYRVTLKTADGSTLIAYFKLK